MSFIYVMTERDADQMLQLGYKLLKKAPDMNVYIFQNKDVTNFALDELCVAEVQFVTSDVLTF